MIKYSRKPTIHAQCATKKFQSESQELEDTVLRRLLVFIPRTNKYLGFIMRALFAFNREREQKPFFSFDPNSELNGSCSSDGNVQTDKNVESYVNHEDPESVDDAKPVKSKNIENGVNDKSARFKGAWNITKSYVDHEDPESVDDAKSVKSKNIEKGVNDKSARFKGAWNITKSYVDHEDPESVDDAKSVKSKNIEKGVNDKSARFKGAWNITKRKKPHVVLLQEAVSFAQKIIQKECPSYILVKSGNWENDIAILLQRDAVTLEAKDIIPFQSSNQGRTLLYVKCRVKGIKFDIVNTHLECNKINSEERKNQLKLAFDRVKVQSTDRTVIFGGDLCLRDNEIEEIGGVPKDIDDVWEVTGRLPETRYTWDLQSNDNLEDYERDYDRELRYGNKPAFRFDRLYIRHCKPNAIVKPVHFQLVGLKRLPSCQKFPSDHWGLLSHFNVPSRMLLSSANVN